MFSRVSPYLLWFILAIPALGMATDIINSDSARIYHRLLHPTGEFAARFLIISLMATPIAMLFKGRRGARWLVKNRRYFGVAAFAYAALHTVFYIVDEGTITRMLAELDDFYIWTGWVAFAVFIPLAATSMDLMVRVMGRAWKPLQRWAYVAALFTLLHWASLHNWRGWPPAAVHFAPLIALTLYRLWWVYLRKRPATPA